MPISPHYGPGGRDGFGRPSPSFSRTAAAARAASDPQANPRRVSFTKSHPPWGFCPPADFRGLSRPSGRGDRESVDTGDGGRESVDNRSGRAASSRRLRAPRATTVTPRGSKSGSTHSAVGGSLLGAHRCANVAPSVVHRCSWGTLGGPPLFPARTAVVHRCSSGRGPAALIGPRPNSGGPPHAQPCQGPAGSPDGGPTGRRARQSTSWHGPLPWHRDRLTGRAAHREASTNDERDHTRQGWTEASVTTRRRWVRRLQGWRRSASSRPPNLRVAAGRPARLPVGSRAGPSAARWASPSNLAQAGTVRAARDARRKASRTCCPR